jgi:aryl-alcohol dehydrogenase-like predicted oxidoreductase
MQREEIVMSQDPSRHLSRRQFMGRAAAATAGVAAVASWAPPVLSASDKTEIEKTRSYNPEMEYRRLGKTGLWVSAICLGGHWKRVDKVLKSTSNFGVCEGELQADSRDMTAFLKNRTDVVSRCIDVGINLIDFAGSSEPPVYAKALQGRRDQMYIAWSMGGQELRHEQHRKAEKLVAIFEQGLKDTGLEYADCWRLMAHERGGLHTEQEVEEMVKALEIAKQRGLCRFTGFSTHDRRWAAMLFEKYPELMQMCCTPYTARTKEVKKNSFFQTVRQQDVGILGIKPFASNAIFKGDGSPESPHVEVDNQLARLTVRYILMNPALTAPIPGLSCPAQVDNMALAVKERRELDLAQRDDSPAGVMPPAERMSLDKATTEMWDNLGPQYQWLKNWEYV